MSNFRAISWARASSLSRPRIPLHLRSSSSPDLYLLPSRFHPSEILLENNDLRRRRPYGRAGRSVEETKCSVARAERKIRALWRIPDISLGTSDSLPNDESTRRASRSSAGRKAWQRPARRLRFPGTANRTRPIYSVFIKIVFQTRKRGSTLRP